jgi:predicted GNAT superfamily acetyltransferase
VLIRDITAADLDAIHAINEAGTPGVHSEPLAALAAITRESSIALVAEVDGVVAGFCQVLPPGASYQSTNYQWFSARYDDFVYLDRVAVAANHRGRGIGGRLYEEVERRTRAAWFTLEVNLRPRNDGSLRFHARHGFVEVGQQETNYGALVCLMAKRLGGTNASR